MSTLQPQAALEQAAVDAIRATLGYTADQCGRCFDGRPPPRCGAVYASVWSDGAVSSKSRVSLDQTRGIRVTVTRRLNLPFDRWLEHRDEVDARLQAIVALIQRDSLNFAITNAANVLANYGPGNTTRVTFAEALAYDRTEPWREVGGEWFWAGTAKDAGIAQTALFGKSRSIQAQGTAI